MLGYVRTDKLIMLIALALSGFAANSLLCRIALREGAIDAGTFTVVRFAAGAVVLAVIVGPRVALASGSWASGAALAVYAVAFSYAYLGLGAGVGAFVLFAAVQATMVCGGVIRGERPTPLRSVGIAVAIAGLAVLTLPGSEAPPLAAAAAMATAGAAWGVYSLRGRGASAPAAATAGNFVRTLPLIPLPALALHVMAPDVHATAHGFVLAIVSGAVASGLAYACWYAALQHLAAAHAGVLQLLVPVLTAVLAIALLGEVVSMRLVAGGAVIVVGIGLTLVRRRALSSRPVPPST
jgi:drug/metabolite transporter (DMT)-like permease